MFEWDDAKAGANLAKHGVSFDEAATISPIRTHWTVRICVTRRLKVGFSASASPCLALS